jgi:hypothetical protein
MPPGAYGGLDVVCAEADAGRERHRGTGHGDSSGGTAGGQRGNVSKWLAVRSGEIDDSERIARIA